MALRSSFFCFSCCIYTNKRYLSLQTIIEEAALRSPNLKTFGEFVSNAYRNNFLILYFQFREAQIMVGGVCTTFYLPLLKLACMLLKIKVYNTGSTTRGRDPIPKKFSTKCSFCSFFLLFFGICTIISELDFDFERVLKLQQLLYFHARTQAPPFAERCLGSKGASFFYIHLSFFLQH